MGPPSPSSSLAAYARAVSSAKDLAAQVRSAVDAATLHAAASPTTPVGPRELHIVALSASARAWEEEMREAAAWGEIVREVSRMLAIRDARAARRALLALEQVCGWRWCGVQRRAGGERRVLLGKCCLASVAGEMLLGRGGQLVV